MASKVWIIWLLTKFLFKSYCSSLCSLLFTCIGLLTVQTCETLMKISLEALMSQKPTTQSSLLSDNIKMY